MKIFSLNSLSILEFPIRNRVFFNLFYCIFVCYSFQINLPFGCSVFWSIFFKNSNFPAIPASISYELFVPIQSKQTKCTWFLLNNTKTMDSLPRNESLINESGESKWIICNPFFSTSDIESPKKADMSEKNRQQLLRDLIFFLHCLIFNLQLICLCQIINSPREKLLKTKKK